MHGSGSLSEPGEACVCGGAASQLGIYLARQWDAAPQGDQRGKLNAGGVVRHGVGHLFCIPLREYLWGAVQRALGRGWGEQGVPRLEHWTGQCMESGMPLRHGCKSCGNSGEHGVCREQPVRRSAVAPGNRSRVGYCLGKVREMLMKSHDVNVAHHGGRERRPEFPWPGHQEDSGGPRPAAAYDLGVIGDWLAATGSTRLLSRARKARRIS